MADRSASPATADSAVVLAKLFDLARSDRAAASRELGRLPVDDAAALVCDTPLARRGALLDLLPNPEAVVPRLPEAELCFTVKALGIGDAAWLLELASVEQVVACLDLDAWRGDGPDVVALDEWLSAIAAGSADALLRAVAAIDAELLVQFLKGRLLVELKPSGDDDWQPPEGGQTLDGQFYFGASREGDDLAPVLVMLRTLFERDYWTYFRLLQGVLWEHDTENQEWAYRWRNGRLEDLGFPPWDESMRIYRYLSPAALAELPEDAKPLAVEGWQLPVRLPELPALSDDSPLLFRTLAELDDEERRAGFFALVALANRVAVADGLPLGDAESVPSAIDKAARLASSGLAYVSAQATLPAAETLRRVPLERLFRVGANLQPDLARPRG